LKLYYFVKQIKSKDLKEEYFMRRCLQIAALGLGNTAPNPMVGAVLVYNNRIIGEGYHRQYGQAHAEVNCLNSVKPGDTEFISKSTMYVSLEPCSHYGKTPPCADLLIKNGVKKVVVGCLDVNEEVAGRGIKKMQQGGVEVQSGILESECRELNKRFFTFHKNKRPYIILKWAQSLDGFIGSGTDERIFLSNPYTNRLVHKWRSEEASILVGTNTALQDDPVLTTRLWTGNNPKRILLDRKLSVPDTHRIYNDEAYTIIFNDQKNEERNNLIYIKIVDPNSLEFILHSLWGIKIQSVLVEGGAKTLQSFIDKGFWDEARVITNTELQIRKGITSPLFLEGKLIKQENYFTDIVSYYSRN
jgi:diaminohydroxyphosphoribosylaminopyrimidine deaminase/5-amino-6-(5-phosphoribosylamino)uracil reductase